jgi:hypothetical protein
MNSKKTLFLCLLVTIFSLSNGLAQSNYYYYQNQKVTKIKKYAKQELIFSKTFIERENKKKDSIASIPPLVSYVATNFLVPYVVKNVPKLFYKPEKYIKEHAQNSSLIESGETFNEAKSISYKNIVFDTINGKIQEDQALIINFKIGQIQNERINDIRYLDLVNYGYKYSPAKLKGTKDKINLIVEVLFQYIDSNGDIQTYKTNPISLLNQVPNGKIELINKKANITILPKMVFVTDVQIKVSEVNSRKKNMDKWLEFYTDNKDKLQSFLVKKIEG